MSLSIEEGIISLTVCKRHQNKRLASRAGITQGITFFSQRRKGAETTFRGFRLPTVLSAVVVSAKGEGVFAKVGVFRGQNNEVAGKRVSVKTPLKTPLKTQGKTPGKTTQETTQETTQKKKKPRCLFATRTKEGIPGCRPID